MILQWLLYDRQNYPHARLALAARSRRQPLVPDGAAVSAGGQPSVEQLFGRLRAALADFLHRH
jgi:hypothetical protein